MENKSGLFGIGIAVAALSASASGTLLPQQVVLLYNSHVPQTVVLKNAYVAAHPGVLTFDINVQHPILTPPWTSGDRPQPDASGMNNFFITKSRFNELFVDPASAYQQFLTANPQILAIATVRGVPAAVTNDQWTAPGSPSVFNPFPTHGSGPGINTPLMGFEAALAARSPNFNILAVRLNYFGSPIGISEYFAACGASGAFNEAPGAFFLATRIDSGVPKPPVDVDGNGVIDEYDGALALIQRSAAPIPVNKYATTSLIDTYTEDPTRPNLTFTQNRYFAGLERALWDSHWPALADRGPQFLHGPNDGGVAAISVPNPPSPPPQEALYFNRVFNAPAGPDGPFTQAYPTLMLATMGRNHSYWWDVTVSFNGEPLHWNYLSAYRAHPAGALFHIESFGGWSIHSPGFVDIETVRQGQGLDWIAIGGSFAWSIIVGPPMGGDPLGNRPLAFFHRFYVQGMTFAEASYASMEDTVRFTFIGDPLARVVVYDADVVLDRVIDQQDIDAVVNAETQRADVNRDGFVDAADLALVQAAFGRNFSAPVLEPSNSFPTSFIMHAHPLANTPITRKRGDVTGDGLTDDLDIMLALQTLWPGSWCLRADVNIDYRVDSNDLAIMIANDGIYHVDFNNNGVLDPEDFSLLCARMWTAPPGSGACVPGSPYTCDPNWDPRFDLNLNGGVDCLEYQFLVSLFTGSAPTCVTCP